MSMTNEAGAVNAQRDAHGADERAAGYPVRSLHEMGRGKSADRPEYPMYAPDNYRVVEGYRERIAALEQQRDAVMELLADALAEAARYERRLIVACEERDTALRDAGHFRRLYAIARHRIYAPSARGRIWSWLRGKAGRCCAGPGKWGGDDGD